MAANYTVGNCRTCLNTSDSLRAVDDCKTINCGIGRIAATTETNVVCINTIYYSRGDNIRVVWVNATNGNAIARNSRQAFCPAPVYVFGSTITVSPSTAVFMAH